MKNGTTPIGFTMASSAISGLRRSMLRFWRAGRTRARGRSLRRSSDRLAVDEHLALVVADLRADHVALAHDHAVVCKLGEHHVGHLGLSRRVALRGLRTAGKP